MVLIAINHPGPVHLPDEALYQSFRRVYPSSQHIHWYRPEKIQDAELFVPDP
jgi:hypothetical protein